MALLVAFVIWLFSAHPLTIDWGIVFVIALIIDGYFFRNRPEGRRWF